MTTNISVQNNQNTLKKRQKRLDKSIAGFTVVEVLVVALIVGILATLSSAGFIGWLNRVRVNAARDAISSAIYDAQSRARQRNAVWQASFRETAVNGKTVIQWAVHSAGSNSPIWNTIEQASGIEIVTSNPATTLTTNGNPSGAWKIQFDRKGYVYDKETPKPKTWRITLSNTGGANKRCVEVKTILGAVGVGQDDDCTKL